MEKEQFYYDNKIVKLFLTATILWGIVGMLVGVLVAFLFLFPNYLGNLSWLSFGRLRPLHTNAVIFAFVGNGFFLPECTILCNVYLKQECLTIP